MCKTAGKAPWAPAQITMLFVLAGTALRATYLVARDAEKGPQMCPKQAGND